MKMMAKLRENRIFMQWFPLLLLAALCILFGVFTGGRFLAVSNLNSMLDQCLVLGTIATGAVFIFGTGNVNMSMGGTGALTAVIGGYAYILTESVPLMLLACIVTGALLSWLSVVLSELTRMTIITITTVMMMLYPAIQSWLLGANSISIPYNVYAPFQKAKAPLIIFCIFLLICVFAYYFTPLGRRIAFIGSNERCAQLTGFYKQKILMTAFVLAGIGCGLGAFSTIIRTGVISTTTLSSGNMNVILSIVIGGMPIFGGHKTRPYAGILGAAVLTVLDSGLLMIGVSSLLLQAVRGILFMIFVVVSWERPQGLPTRGA